MTKKEVYQQAITIIGKRRQQALLEQQERCRDIYARIPQMESLVSQRAKTAITFCKQVLSHTADRAEVLSQMQQRNQHLQSEIRSLLEQHGYAPDALEDSYTCPACQDTGFIQTAQGQQRCRCLKHLMIKIDSGEFNRISGLPGCSFETFSLAYYKKPEDAVRMQGVLSFCQDYAATFSPRSKSVLMIGGVGLGKTHLSIAIAKQVIERGYHPLYLMAYDLFFRLNQEQFGKGDPDQNTWQDVSSAELLVIDDLGTEQAGNNHQAAVFHLINTRLQAGKPMIISSNLSFKEIQRRYGDRMISRLATLCHCVFFNGEDVRQQQLVQSQSELQRPLGSV